jgi:TPR repeat protein
MNATMFSSYRKIRQSERSEGTPLPRGLVRRSWQISSAAIAMALACILLLALFSPHVQATTDPLEEGKAAYLANDYKRAFEILKPLAEQGSPDAQITLGIMYDYGQGVPKDDVLATQWYSKAAMQGIPAVQHNLGVKYFEGIGIEKNYAEAEKWWQMAAKLGFAESQYSLGEMYAYGMGAPRNDAEAAHWYELAANQGHALAQYRLGVMCAAGRGVPLDAGRAYFWLSKSAGQGMPQAQYQVGRFNEEGLGVTPNAEAARKWYALAAKQGYGKAKRRLAVLDTRGQTSNNAALSAASTDRAADSADDAGAMAAKSSTQQPMPAAAGAPHREDWIRSQAPQRYTLQLVTASNEQSVMDLLGRAGLGPQVAYFRRAMNDRTGYTAIFGVFDTRADASQALSQLPSELLKTRPWVRSFAEVQALAQ